MSDQRKPQKVAGVRGRPRTGSIALKAHKPPLHERNEKGHQAAYTPTDEQRRTVRTLAACGTPMDQIEKVLDITRHTLKKYFQRELDTGAPEANAQVAQALFKAATKGGSVPAQIAWLDRRAGWKQSSRLEHVGEDGGPVKVETIRRVIIDPKKNDEKDE